MIIHDASGPFPALEIYLHLYHTPSCKTAPKDNVASIHTWNGLRPFSVDWGILTIQVLLEEPHRLSASLARLSWMLFWKYLSSRSNREQTDGSLRLPSLLLSYLLSWKHLPKIFAPLISSWHLGLIGSGCYKTGMCLLRLREILPFCRILCCGDILYHF